MAQLLLWEEMDKAVNVSAVPQRSPFRYPGGKTWLVPRIRQWLDSFPVRPGKFIEPFAGGAIVGLTVAFENLADSVLLVERDEDVAAVWQTIINTPRGAAWLANEIVSFNLTHESASKLLASPARSVRQIAFRTIVRNRISHGGVLAQGAGILKNGENNKGILSRWYPDTLKRRILDIGSLGKKIKFQDGDGLKVIRSHADNANAVFFIDPPYTASTKRAGSRLYKYHEINHEGLFSLMSQVKGDFLMTYDDAEEVRALAVKLRFETRQIAMNNKNNIKMMELLIGRNLNWLPPES